MSYIKFVDCEASYVGQIKRHLKMRINEHTKNINYDESRHSVITNYMLEKIIPLSGITKTF